MIAATALLRETAASARSQPVPSILTAVMVAGMCIAVLLTAGRTAATEQAVLAEIDAAGTRSIVVRAADDAGLTVAILDRLAAVEGIESVAGFGPITDSHNALIPGGRVVAVRNVYGTIGTVRWPVKVGTPTEDVALASAAAARHLGLRDGVGGLVSDAGHSATVVGSLPVPDYLRFLEPIIVVPSDQSSRGEPLTVLVVLVEAPRQVAAITAVVRSFLVELDQSTVSVETSEQLAAVRSAVSGELGSYGRETVLGIVAVAAVLVAINLLALVAMRRKDFGRRRALGASRSLIVGLLLAQVALLAGVGAVLGTAGTLAGLVVTANSTPNLEFSLAVAAAAVLTAVLAAVVPAAYAATRDPLHELRVP